MEVIPEVLDCKVGCYIIMMVIMIIIFCPPVFLLVEKVGIQHIASIKLIEAAHDSFLVRFVCVT